MSGRNLASSLTEGLRGLGSALATPAASREPLLRHASSRWVRSLPYALAFGFGAALLPSTAQLLSTDYGLHGSWAGALGVAQVVPLLLAVTRPLPAWWLIFTADVLGALLLLVTDHTAGRPWPWTPMVLVGYLLLCLALALRESRRTLLAVWLVTVVASLALGIVAPERSEGSNVLLIVLSGATLLLGATLRERAEAQRRLAEQETISETERAQRTLLEERTRIARELHDVVAHHMSVITVQADSAPYRIAGLPREASEEFGAIAAAARESLTEMRRLLGVLRSENAHSERAPQPGLERLEQLVEATVRAGVPAELHLDLADGQDGAPGGGPGPAQTVTLSAYRIVQEALANVVRHAPGAATRISVTVRESGRSGREGNGGDGGDDKSGARENRSGARESGNGERPDAKGAREDESSGPEDRNGEPEDRNGERDDENRGPEDENGGREASLFVLVVNGPSPAPEGPPLETSGTGHGLVGMRERVRLVGGALEVGPLPDGGFRVAARLPLHPPAGTPMEPSGVLGDERHHGAKDAQKRAALSSAPHTKDTPPA
ncbi:histidine kinase [Streptomyces tubbatahanensis]|uniref:histidine kinase n=1 Tax=Streptomyces tubbatahanensis TaxID=2923272 RepID=A0ABY3XQY5_9ACTN|nr:histidine kinase [Streptomyces tubbatahanensis]UNS96868.1 histidine kinase [Streptomyces tubbatahanensis]